MHRCLLIAEILALIIDFSTCYSQKAEAYHLALTCKAFSESALDALWRETYGLMQLIRLLPADLWHSAEDLPKPESSCMVRETVESDWTRFLIHARRVRELTYRPLCPEDNYLWNPTIFEADIVLRHIHQQCPEANILPNLVTLTWSSTTKNIEMFIGPTLQNLRLTFSTAAEPGALELLESHSPMITSLYFSGGFFPSVHATDDIVDAVSLVVTRMHRLVTFSSGFEVRSRALAHLSTLPMLRHLTVPLRIVDDPTFFSSASSLPFPSITHLVVRPTQPTMLYSFLNTMSSNCLDYICWEISDMNPSNILNILMILARHPSRNVLSTISISVSRELIMQGVPFPNELVTFHTLTPLLSHTNLTQLNLAAIWWLDLGNEDLEQIALNLPRLTSLHLGTLPGLIVPPRITLCGLLPIIQHCTLRDLGVVVDAGDHVPDSEFILPLEPPAVLTRNARRLRFLDFGNSRIGATKVATTALFLSRLIPCLTTLKAWSVLIDLQNPLLEPQLWNRVADTYGELTVHEQSENDWLSWQGFNQ
ncbi:hypothetical protein FB451DRAFT_1101142 [Mycena latifolia]|nr:hypothetical protein FB451DRAFT_1101142 [Mycena latifolia]